MPHWLIDGMIYLGSLLMVYNIYGFVRYAGKLKKREDWRKQNAILYVPIFLLVFFLLGYLGVGLFGNPDLLVAGILFGGSAFVFIIYRLVNDITVRIINSERHEAELIAAEESTRAKNSFMATISHEMRTPMNIILGLDSLALKNPDLPDKVRDQLEKIGQNGEHMMDLINNTLNLLSITSGGASAKSEPFELKAAFEQIDAIAQTLCEAKQLDYRSECRGNTERLLLGDEMMLKQVLLSLLDNAVKFTDVPGRVSFTAGVVMSGDDRITVRFSVTDTGIGMSKEFLNQLFQPFTKENDGMTSRHGGTGIGLTIARRQAELMGGDITATSEPGKGSAFIVTIPFAFAPARQQEEKEEPETDCPPLAGCRVLIVEDTDENAEIVADLLELEDAQSERAENGQIAVDMFSASETGYYDAVLMDLRMPVMDGLEATRRIRALDRADARQIPIIALSANAFESDIRKSLESGMNAHLAKPADADLLYGTIRKWIGKARKGGNEA